MSNALPADDLCVENAIMLKRFNRYPLIIDPSGQATEFLLNEYKEKKILKTRWVVALCGDVLLYPCHCLQQLIRTYTLHNTMTIP